MCSVLLGMPLYLVIVLSNNMEANGIWFLGSSLEVHSSAVQSVVGHGE